MSSCRSECIDVSWWYLGTLLPNILGVTAEMRILVNIWGHICEGLGSPSALGKGGWFYRERGGTCSKC